MTPATLLTPAPGLFRMRDLRARHGADVGAFAVGLVQLEARRARLVRPPRRLVYPVPRVGAHKHRLPDDVVRGVAVVAEAERSVDLGARGGAVKGWLWAGAGGRLEWEGG
jgi:hypothetical protein